MSCAAACSRTLHPSVPHTAASLTRALQGTLCHSLEHAHVPLPFWLALRSKRCHNPASREQLPSAFDLYGGRWVLLPNFLGPHKSLPSSRERITGNKRPTITKRNCRQNEGQPHQRIPYFFTSITWIWAGPLGSLTGWLTNQTTW